MFAKTHKTGSTTLQNLILRFGDKHSLNFAFPPDEKTEDSFRSTATAAAAAAAAPRQNRKRSRESIKLSWVLLVLLCFSYSILLVDLLDLLGWSSVWERKHDIST